MLTEVKNQLKVTLLSIKYALIREMLNKTTFISNIVFMILNNATFIIQWIIIYSLKDSISGYTLKEIMLLWGLAAGTFGFSRFFFDRAFSLDSLITDGKLDSYLVQPKNVLLSCITSDVKASALGDMIYAYIMLILYGITFKNFLLFTFYTISGGLILTCISVILCSLSFWFTKADVVAEAGNSLVTNFATYPDGIFKGVAKMMLYTIIPVGMTIYIPLKTIISFSLSKFLLIVFVTILFISLAFYIFDRGLKRYSSSNLMVARI